MNAPRRVDGFRADASAPARVGAGDLDAAPELSDVLVAAQSGHELGFRLLYRAVQPSLLRYLRGVVGEDAEDVASETWAQIARDLGSFRGDGDGFRGWAATIARHRALDHLRRVRRRPVTTHVREELLERRGDDDTESLVLQGLATDGAIALIATLPSEMAEAVLLRVVMGLDAQMAGEVLGRRAGAVRTAAHRGLRRLAAALNSARWGNESTVRGISAPRGDLDA